MMDMEICTSPIQATTESSATWPVTCHELCRRAKGSISICSLLGSYGGGTIAGNSGSWGTGRSELYNPYGIHVTDNGTMFILDTSNYRVLRWSSTEPLGTIVVNGRGSGTTLDRIGVSYAFFVDSQNNIFVSESSNHRVTRWAAGNNTAGALVRSFHAI